jgi:hypothetical protein
MKFIKIGLLLLLILTIGMFAYNKINHSTGPSSKPPVIEDSLKILHVNSSYTYTDLLEGLTATDDVDGDLTDQIMVGEFSPISEGNSTSYNCVVFDSDGQCSEFNRKMVIDDYAHPRIYLNSPLLFYAVDSKDEMPREYFTAIDKIDGDITDRIQLTNSTIDFSTIGDYSLAVSVDNSFGDSVTYNFPIHVRERVSSLFIRLTRYVTYIRRNSAFNPMEYIKATSNDYITVETPFDLSVKSNVDTSNPGLYEVEYTLAGESIAIPAKTFLVVIVS